MYAIEHIPYNLTGKKMEVPVRRILSGVPPDLAVSRALMMEPEAIDWFVQFRDDNRPMLDGSRSEVESLQAIITACRIQPDPTFTSTCVCRRYPED